MPLISFPSFFPLSLNFQDNVKQVWRQQAFLPVLDVIRKACSFSTTVFSESKHLCKYQRGKQKECFQCTRSFYNPDFNLHLPVIKLLP